MRLTKSRIGSNLSITAMMSLSSGVRLTVSVTMRYTSAEGEVGWTISCTERSSCLPLPSLLFIDQLLKFDYRSSSFCVEQNVFSFETTLMN